MAAQPIVARARARTSTPVYWTRGEAHKFTPAGAYRRARLHQSTSNFSASSSNSIISAASSYTSSRGIIMKSKNGSLFGKICKCYARPRMSDAEVASQVGDTWLGVIGCAKRFFEACHRFFWGYHVTVFYTVIWTDEVSWRESIIWRFVGGAEWTLLRDQ